MSRGNISQNIDVYSLNVILRQNIALLIKMKCFFFVLIHSVQVIPIVQPRQHPTAEHQQLVAVAQHVV